MSVYLIAQIDVRDAATYAAYVAAARPLVEAAGGVYRVQGGRPHAVGGGGAPHRMVVIEFPSLSAARGCFESDAYRRIAPLRERSTSSRAWLVEGVASP